MVPFCGLYLDSYKVIPNRNYLEAIWVETAKFAEPQKPKRRRRGRCRVSDFMIFMGGGGGLAHVRVHNTIRAQNLKPLTLKGAMPRVAEVGEADRVIQGRPLGRPREISAFSLTRGT